MEEKDALPIYRRRRRKRRWKSRFALLWVILTSSALLLFSAFVLSRHQGPEQAERTATGSIADNFNQRLPSTARVLGPDTSDRPIYPYSIIAGGVRSAEELKRAISRDAVISGHYSDFNLAKARIIESKTEKLAYVSYRIGSHVFWTKKKIRVPKGEELITDGVNYAKTRCGNRISETPKLPTFAGEPSSMELNTPLHARRRDPKPVGTVPGFLAANAPSGSLPVIPVIIAPGGSQSAPPQGGPVGNSSVPAVAPEPGTFLLISTGFGGCWLYRRLFKKGPRSR